MPATFLQFFLHVCDAQKLSTSWSYVKKEGDGNWAHRSIREEARRTAECFCVSAPLETTRVVVTAKSNHGNTSAKSSVSIYTFVAVVSTWFLVPPKYAFVALYS